MGLFEKSRGFTIEMQGLLILLDGIIYLKMQMRKM